MMTKHGEAEQIAAYFRYLDELRDGGSINMFGAAPYLADMFHLPRDEARKILSAWQKTYDPVQTPMARAMITVAAR